MTDIRTVRLVPWPRSIRQGSGSLRLTNGLALHIPDDPALRHIAGLLAEDAQALGIRIPVETTPAGGLDGWLGHRTSVGTPPGKPEGYVLRVTPQGAGFAAADTAGLARALQTLRQLIRTSRRQEIPSLRIVDWPLMKRRGFQVDITRGPSPHLRELERTTRLGALLRHSFVTYYQEYQFAYPGHPTIGPEDGSQTPDELAAWDRQAALNATELVGCQQSFGHMAGVLQRPAYRDLAENPDILNPTDERTYALLADMIGSQARLTSSPLFNVCCDETFGLGEGPSKALAQEIGVGGVYARHMQRVHQIVTQYGKRMMMWGDIITMHPEHLKSIPRDTVMLAWEYSPLSSFESRIAPFRDAGYEYMVCPGTNCWSRLLPDFRASEINIRNFVRDGLNGGASGMLNTTWGDDGELMFALNWPSIAWGAECSWNGESTDYDRFLQRLGGVLFGESGSRFGDAVRRLSRLHSMAETDGLFNSRFWRQEGSSVPVTRAQARANAEAMLAVIDPALDDLKALRSDARYERDLIDRWLFAVSRIRLIAERRIALLDVSQRYVAAYMQDDASLRRRALSDADARIRQIVEAHVACQREFVRHRRSEHKRFGESWITGRFDRLVADWNARLLAAGRALAATQPVPPAEAGLLAGETGRRSQTATRVSMPVQHAAAWAVPEATNRFRIELQADTVDRRDQPLEVQLPGGPWRDIIVTWLQPDGRQQPLPSQLEGGRVAVALLPGAWPAGESRTLLLYTTMRVRRPRPATSLTRVAPGLWRLDDAACSWTVGAEGAHIYRWLIHALDALDVTHPGDTDWAGFGDITGVHRNARNRVKWTVGPCRTVCTLEDTAGMRREYTFWSGCDWVECQLDRGVNWFSCYDDESVLGARGRWPGQALFSDGHSGPVLPMSADASKCQIRRGGVRWCCKYAPGGPAIALLTPEVAAGHMVGPGGGMGGVCLEGGWENASHLVMVASRAQDNMPQHLNALCRALDYSAPPKVLLHPMERRVKEATG